MTTTQDPETHHPIVWLHHAGQHLGLVPTLGGSVAAWQIDDPQDAAARVDLWRPWDGITCDLYKLASFAMVPWSNRISGGGFEHAGQFHPLSGSVLQRQLESNAFVLGGRDYSAPGQLVGEFIAGKPSTQLGSVEPSYKPGVALGDLHAALPGYAIEALREALPVFGRKIKGFDMHDAVLTGVETRTSSPLKIGRGENLQSLNTPGLYPAGEGASYAGGILSAGVDGIKVGEAVARSLLSAAG